MWYVFAATDYGKTVKLTNPQQNMLSVYNHIKTDLLLNLSSAFMLKLMSVKFQSDLHLAFLQVTITMGRFVS